MSQKTLSSDEIVTQITRRINSTDWGFSIYEDGGITMAVLYTTKDPAPDVVKSTYDALKNRQAPDPKHVVKSTRGKMPEALQKLLDWIVKMQTDPHFAYLEEYARKNSHCFCIFPDRDTSKVMAVIFRKRKVTKAEMDSTIDAIKRDQNSNPTVVVTFTYAKESQALQDLVIWVKRERIIQDPLHVYLSRYAESKGHRLLEYYDMKKGEFTFAFPIQMSGSGKPIFGDLKTLFDLLQDEEKDEDLKKITIEMEQKSKAKERKTSSDLKHHYQRRPKNQNRGIGDPKSKEKK